MKNSVALMVQYALSFLGTPYRWGGDDPMAGFDCSGFVQEALASIGMDPKGDQTAMQLFVHFLPISKICNFVDPIPVGALVFYGPNLENINHIAMVVGHAGEVPCVIEAGGGGSKTVSLQAAIEQNAYIRIRPYNRRPDCVAILVPTYP